MQEAVKYQRLYHLMPLAVLLQKLTTRVPFKRRGTLCGSVQAGISRRVLGFPLEPVLCGDLVFLQRSQICI